MLHAKKISLLLGLLGSLSATAQSTINSTGGSAVISGITHSWSVGEMSLVNTATATNIIVTQGVLQPDGNGALAVNTVSLPGSFEVFPNPASDVIHLRYQFPQAGVLQCMLLDATGKMILRRQITAAANGSTETLNLQDIPVGTYLLQVALTTDNGVVSNATYTIQKLN